MKDDAPTAKRKPGPTRYSAAVERAEQRAREGCSLCPKESPVCPHDENGNIRKGTCEVNATRVDIQREGWTTGTDAPLPKACQIATCHHKEHQLTKDSTHAVHWKTPEELDITEQLQAECDCIPAGARVDLHEAAGTLRAELARICPQHGEEAASEYRAAIIQELLLMGHTESSGWCAPSACAVGICTNSDEHDPDCKGPGWAYKTPIVAAPLLDLPTISVKRGGIRYSRVHLSIKREGWRNWYVLATVDAGVAFIGPFKNRKKAESAQAAIRSITNALEGLQ